MRPIVFAAPCAPIGSRVLAIRYDAMDGLLGRMSFVILVDLLGDGGKGPPRKPKAKGNASGEVAETRVAFRHGGDDDVPQFSLIGQTWANKNDRRRKPDSRNGRKITNRWG